jgi:hypothetical protein
MKRLFAVRAEPAGLARMRGALSLLFGVVAAALAPATPAVAVEPATFVFTVDNFTWTDELCGFPITHVENGTGKFAVFFDQQGNPVRSIATDMGRVTISASANGKTLLSNEPTVLILDLEANTLAQLGLIVAFHVPGGGVILLAAGRLVVVPTGAPPAPADVIAIDGPHQPIQGDVAAYCGYFAP